LLIHLTVIYIYIIFLHYFEKIKKDKGKKGNIRIWWILEKKFLYPKFTVLQI
jgi:hypothetical protein